MEDSLLMTIDPVLSAFPKSRPELSAAHQASYLDEIKINRGEEGGLFYRLLVKLESWMHVQVAAFNRDEPVLEIGAGTLNHLPYEPEVTTYDVVEPIKALYEPSPNFKRVRRFYGDIAELELVPTYGRVATIAALEHVERLPEMLARVGLMLRDDGQLRAGIPSEGGFLWGASWRCTTGILYRLRTGLPYAPLMRHEHVNEAEEIVALARHFFDDVKTRRFPLPFLHLSFYTFFVATGPKREICSGYLDQLNKPKA